jgi:hypothetical protein
MALKWNLSAEEPSALRGAWIALEIEAAKVQSQIDSLEARLGQIRAAMSALKPLLPTPFLAQTGQNTDDEISEGLEKSNPFYGLAFSSALYKFMLNKPPSTTGEMAVGFETAGWKFKANQSLPARVNQIGVTMRRFEGKLFRRVDENRWVAVTQHGNPFQPS